MDLDRLLLLPGFQAAVVSFCLLCLVLLLFYCLFRFTAVSRHRGAYTSMKRRKPYSGVKILPKDVIPQTMVPSAGGKRPVLKKNFSVTKQLSVSDRNVKRIKHEYESNGIRFDKKQNFLKSQATARRKKNAYTYDKNGKLCQSQNYCLYRIKQAPRIKKSKLWIPARKSTQILFTASKEISAMNKTNLIMKSP